MYRIQMMHIPIKKIRYLCFFVLLLLFLFLMVHFDLIINQANKQNIFVLENKIDNNQLKRKFFIRIGVI